MTKPYLKFVGENEMFIPQLSRRLRLRRFCNVAFKTDAPEEDDDDDEDDEDSPKAERKKLLGQIRSSVKRQLSGKADQATVDKIADQLVFLTRGKNEKGEDIDAPFPIETLRAMADEKTGVMAKLVEMGTKIQEMEARASSMIDKKSVRAQVTKWHEDNKAAIAQIRSGHKVNLPSLELRDAVTMHFSTVNAGSSPYIGTTEIEPGVNSILRFPTTFWDFLTKGRTGAKTYVWVNMVSPEGAAAFIGPGVAKPGVSFSLEAENSVAKKIADSAKAGTELLDDIDGMVTFIEGELKEQLMQKVNSTLMDSVGTSTVPTGIKQLSQDVDGAAFATAFTALKTTNPNYMDAVRSIVAALRSGKLTGEITVFINSVDSGNMDMSKAQDSGVYLLPPFVTADGRTIAGAKVVEDPNIPIGEVQAGFMKYYRILIYKDYTVTWGWENDDLTKNLVTVVGEMRLHQFFNTRHTGAFFRDTFADVIAKITQV